MRVDVIEMEMAVQQRLGYLERYKDMANYRIMSLQKQLEESVPVSKLDVVNKEYGELVERHRELLDKHESAETTSASLHEHEQLNKKYENEIGFLRRELENEKDKSHMLEESLNRLSSYSGGGGGGTDQMYSSAIANKLAHNTTTNANNNEMLTMAKRLTVAEMKELNERQRAEHAQRMYDEQRQVLRTLENRNLELEDNYSKLSKLYLQAQRVEQQLRDELSKSVPGVVDEAQKKRIAELEKNEQTFKLEVSRLRELAEIALYQTASLEFINKVNKTHLDCLTLVDVHALSEEAHTVGQLHRQIILLQISEATAVRKLQQAQQRGKKLEAQLVRTEQKHDKESVDYFHARQEYISKIGYLRASVQDLRHKYAGSVPMRQQERLHAAKAHVAELRAELEARLRKALDEKHELDDKIAEYEERCKMIDMLKSAASVGKDGSVKFNERFLESFKRSENLRMINLKLERANKRLKDEVFFLFCCFVLAFALA
jgi:centrosomal protein CEP290